MRGDNEDLTARLIGLRDVLRAEIASGQALASARMDGMDAARNQYLGSLESERDALSARIQTVRELAHTENESLENVFNLLLDKLQHQIDQRFTANQETIKELRFLLDERYATQTKALDAAFKAAEQAVAVALANAEKATEKAEAAASDRFDSVNEFRKTLTDQTNTFIPRAEYDTAHNALADRVQANLERLAAIELRLTSRLDRGEGVDVGSSGQRAEQRLNASQAVAVIVAVIIAVGVVVSVLTFAHK